MTLKGFGPPIAFGVEQLGSLLDRLTRHVTQIKVYTCLIVRRVLQTAIVTEGTFSAALVEMLCEYC